VPIHVRSSFSDAVGTWIVDERDAERLGAPVTGAALAKDEARITIRGVPDRPGVVHAVFRTIAAAKIVVDMIVQNVSRGGTTEVSFTVGKGDLPETLRAAEAAAREIGATSVTHDSEVAKVSVVGLGMRTHTGVATTLFQVLAEAGINIQMITTSEIKISVLVDRTSAAAALRVAHQAFGLEQSNIAPTTFTPRGPVKDEPRTMKLVPLVDTDAALSGPRQLGMEDLVIGGVDLDESQARVSLFHVPDRPGYAALVFAAIGKAGVFVDMIVQNVAMDGDSLLSFTVPRESADRAVATVQKAGIADVSVEPVLAKLSVVGVGMRTHTGVATRMFAALAERGININLINTSEVRINVGTDVSRGREALECLRHAFALATDELKEKH
jgi:aspartate kinase